MKKKWDLPPRILKSSKRRKLKKLWKKQQVGGKKKEKPNRGELSGKEYFQLLSEVALKEDVLHPMLNFILFTFS